MRSAPVREFSFPYDQIAVDFSNPAYGLSHKGQAGLFKVENLFVHTASGLAFLAPGFGIPPIGIMESGLEDYQLLAERSPTYRAFAGFRPNKALDINFGRPAFLFNIFRNKSNYYHFFVDNALRLITFLERNRLPVTILTTPHDNKYMDDFFTLIKQIYHCNIEVRPNKAKYYKICSPLLFMENVLRNVGNFSTNEEWVNARIKKDPPVNLGGNDTSLLQPNREYYLTPKSWRFGSTHGDRVKNNTVLFLPSQTSINCFESFVSRVEEMGGLRQTDARIVYISRSFDSKRGRVISNEKALLDAIPEAKPINFGTLPLTEQMSVARNADILIGLHGAGLTNALFMRKNTKVIEITPATQSIPASNLFENLCVLRRLGYQRIYSSRLDENGHTEVNPTTVATAVRSSDI